ncbi:uncharacterized protein BXZ73DRAFT_56401, partial [Epithele typhae]|uniref:uncharacterized protein n=1 Tax=Epithele typhae TaxID=378194 RepID=UPI0020084DCA
FWDGNRAWLLRRGFALYSFEDIPPGRKLSFADGKKWCTPKNAPPSEPVVLPWAKHVRGVQRPTFRLWVRLLLRPCTSSHDARPQYHIAPARDFSGRDLILKPIARDSREYAICKFLLTAADYTDPSTFPCIIPPLAVLDTPYDYSILCMPRWSEVTWLDDVETPREFICLAICLLRGLDFLHSHRIAHRDIVPCNMLANCYRPDDDDDDVLRADLRERRGRGDCENILALMDFDKSILLPPNTSLINCRRPSLEATGDGFFAPDDIDYGAPYYNPFAYDVATLGGIFRYCYADMASVVPSFAPLFDRMTTHLMRERFTVEELCAS